MKFITKILAMICLTLFFSCSNDTVPASEANQIKDDFSYLAVNSSGKIQKIGNNTGKISTFSQFEGLNQSNFIHLNNITTNSEKIFLSNHISPFETLYIFDKKTKTTRSKELIFPKEIIGQEPGLTSLIWDESKKILYGIVVDNVFTNYSTKTCYFIKINPDNFTINYEGVVFNQTASRTAFLNSGKIYSSSFENDEFTIEIDLENNTTKKILSHDPNIAFIKASGYNNNTAYCLRIEKNKPTIFFTKLNLINNSYEDLLPIEKNGLYPYIGNGFIDQSNNQYINYIVNDGQCILKYNISTNTYTTLKVTSDTSIDDNLIIIDKIDN